MKNKLKILGLVVLTVLVIFTMTTCGDEARTEIWGKWEAKSNLGWVYVFDFQKTGWTYTINGGLIDEGDEVIVSGNRVTIKDYGATLGAADFSISSNKITFTSATGYIKTANELTGSKPWDAK